MATIDDYEMLAAEALQALEEFRAAFGRLLAIEHCETPAATQLRTALEQFQMHGHH